MSDKTTYAYDTECDIIDLEVGIVKNVDVDVEVTSISKLTSIAQL